MSRSSEYSYALEKERRRQIYLNTITAKTEQFYNRYNQQYRDMKDKGFAAYIPDEMNRLESDLARIRSLLTSDPEAAREISYEVGEYIRSMSSLAYEARQQFERSERMRAENLRAEKEHQHNELMQEYFKILQTVNNPIVVNFAISEMQQIKADIEKGNLTKISELRKRSSDVIAVAEKKGGEWKETTAKKNRQKNAVQAISEAEERLKSERIENQQKTQEFLDRINKLRAGIETGAIDADSVEKQVVELENEVDNTLISEETIVLSGTS